MTSNILKELSCTFLPGKFDCKQQVPNLYNEVYKAWRKIWKEIFIAAGSPDSLNTESFLRQNIIFTLHHGDEIAGILTTTFFNLSALATFDHAYFRPFPTELIKSLESNPTGVLITSEYLSVHPDYRKSIVGVSLSEVLIGMVVRVLIQLNAKMLLGTAVRPAGVHKSCKKFGYKEVGSYEKYGLDCVLLSNTPEEAHEHADPKIRMLISQYWNNKTDLTGIAEISSIETVKAA